MKTLAVVLLCSTLAFGDGAPVMRYYPPQPAPVQSSNGNNQAAMISLGVGLAVSSVLIALHVRKVHKARAARMNIYLAGVK